MQDANPPIRPRTQAELDDSFRESYINWSFEFGYQYYIAGRFATAAAFRPVAGSIIHHAVELLLKSCLATSDTAAQIRAYRNTYRHGLNDLWNEFRNRKQDPSLAQYDDILTKLNQFEKVRYPEKLIDRGALLSIGLVEPTQPTTTSSTLKVPHYELYLPQIDRLVDRLARATGRNFEAWRQHLDQEHARRFFRLENATPFLMPQPQ